MARDSTRERQNKNHYKKTSQNPKRAAMHTHNDNLNLSKLSSSLLFSSLLCNINPCPKNPSQ